MGQASGLGRGTHEQRVESVNQGLQTWVSMALRTQRPGAPTVLKATPGLGKTRAFALEAVELLRQLFRHLDATTNPLGRSDFYDHHQPLLYSARTVGEIRAVKEQILAIAHKDADPAFRQYVAENRDRLLVIAPTYAGEEHAKARQMKTGEPNLLVYHKTRQERIEVSPDLCYRADLAEEILAARYHSLSEHICHNCPSREDTPPCGTRHQLQKAFVAPVVFSTVNRLEAEDDRLRYLQLDAHTRVPRAGFVDDYSEPLFAFQEITRDQIDTWDWALQLRCDRIRKQGQDKDKAQNEIPEDQLLAAMEILQTVLIPGLRHLQELGTKRLARWMHAPRKKEKRGFFEWGGMAPLHNHLRKLWRDAERKWQERLGHRAGGSLTDWLTESRMARDIDYPLLDGDALQIPGNLLRPLLTCSESGGFVTAWKTVNGKRTVVFQCIQLRSTWRQIRKLGYIVADATPDPEVEAYLGKTESFTVPLHPESEIEWRVDPRTYHAPMKRYDRVCKDLGDRILPRVQAQGQIRDQRQAIITHKVLFSHLLKRDDSHGVDLAYYGGGGNEGHRAQNQFTGLDLHVIGLPMLAPAEIARRYLALRWIHAVAPGKAVAGTIKEDLDIPTPWGDSKRVAAVPSFVDPLAQRIARQFVEREMVQTVHRARPVRHATKITLYAPAMRLDLATWGLESPQQVVQPNAQDVRSAVFIRESDGQKVDLRVADALTRPLPRRDPRGRKRTDLPEWLPSIAALKGLIRSRTGCELHTNTIKEQLHWMLRQNDASPRAVQRWCQRMIRKMVQEVTPGSTEKSPWGACWSYVQSLLALLELSAERGNEKQMTRWRNLLQWMSLAPG